MRVDSHVQLRGMMPVFSPQEEAEIARRAVVVQSTPDGNSSAAFVAPTSSSLHAELSICGQRMFCCAAEEEEWSTLDARRQHANP